MEAQLIIENVIVLFSLAIFIIMLTVGMSLEFSKTVFSEIQPSIFCLGLSCQLIGLPLLAFALVSIFKIPEVYSIGLILMSLSPCGACCGAITMFMNANTKLSILLTVVSSLLVPITMPLGVFFLLGETMPLSPEKTIVNLLSLIVLPVVSGIIIRRKFNNERFLSALKKLSFGLLICILMAILIQHRQAIFEASYILLLPCLLMVLVAYVLPKYLGSLFTHNDLDTKTIGVQVGLQNGTSALAVILATPGLSQAAISIALYSVISFLVAFVLIPIWGEFKHNQSNSVQSSIFQ